MLRVQPRKIEIIQAFNQETLLIGDTVASSGFQALDLSMCNFSETIWGQGAHVISFFSLIPDIIGVNVYLKIEF